MLTGRNVRLSNLDTSCSNTQHSLSTGPRYKMSHQQVRDSTRQ